MINRREFMQKAYAGALGTLAFSQFGFRGSGGGDRIQKIGLQLYTVRNEMEKDIEGTLAKVAAIGFKEVEFAGYYNRTTEQIKTILKTNGLTAPSAHTVLATMKSKDWQKTVEDTRAIGHKYLVLAYLFPPERQKLDDYKQIIEVMNRAAEDCKKAGIQFAYHNHDFEFQSMEGQMPYDLILKETDPKLVKMELDLYWITKAKQQPEKYFAMYPGRFELFHVKDMDNTPKEFFTEVGRGVIDFKRIFRMKNSGVKHYFVEQDQTPGSPLESIKISYDYLQKLRF